MSDTYDELRERYADSIWLRSEITHVRGPLRNSFDPPHEPHPFLLPEPDRYEVTLTTASGKGHSVETFGRVDVALFSTGEHLLIFRTIFGEALADFAVVTQRVVQNDGVSDNRSIANRTPYELSNRTDGGR